MNAEVEESADPQTPLFQDADVEAAISQNSFGEFWSRDSVDF